MRFPRLLLHFTLLTTTAAGIAQPSGFTDIATGTDIQYSFEDPSDFGLGISFIDINGDGFDDLSFGGLDDEPLHIYLSDSSTFLRSTLQGLSQQGSSKSMVWADFDNDGDQDLAIAHLGARVKLYRNDGDLRFTDISDEAGIETTVLYAYAACWCDYDTDGYLDLYVTNRNGFDPTRSRNALYRNNGNGTFENVAESVHADDRTGIAFGCAFFDYDRDGWPDIYIANDKSFTKNTLLRNNGNGTFEDVSEPNTTGKMMDGMGIAVGDYDGNGFEDLYVTNTAQSSIDFGGNLLLRNHGDGTFTDVADSLGMRVFSTGWGANFTDLDNDGDLDLFTVNENSTNEGRINRIFVNDGNGAFTEDTLTAIYTTYRRSFGSAFGDFNNDGYPDLAVINSAGDNIGIWQNHGGDTHWIKVQLEGIESNRDGVGSWVEIYTAERLQQRYTRRGSGYGSQNTSTLMIGTGDHETVDSLVIRWPSGIVDRYTGLETSRTHHFVEGASIDTSGGPRDTTVISGIATGTGDLGPVLYPNPTSGNFQIALLPQNGPVQVDLLDAEGRILRSFRFASADRARTAIYDASMLSAGTYWVRIRSRDADRVRPLILR